MPKRKPNTPAGSPMSRRHFVRAAGAAAIAATGFTARDAAASELPAISEDDPMAKSLNYVHDANDADGAKRVADSYCNNCVLYAGTPDDEWAGCSVFPGKAVAGKGWCSVWARK